VTGESFDRNIKQASLQTVTTHQARRDEEEDERRRRKRRRINKTEFQNTDVCSPSVRTEWCGFVKK